MSDLTIKFHDTGASERDGRASHNPKAYELRRLTKHDGSPVSANVSAKDWQQLQGAAKSQGLSIISIFNGKVDGIEGTYAKVAKIDPSAPRLAA